MNFLDAMNDMMNMDAVFGIGNDDAVKYYFPNGMVATEEFLLNGASVVMIEDSANKFIGS